MILPLSLCAVRGTLLTESDSRVKHVEQGDLDFDGETRWQL